MGILSKIIEFLLKIEEKHIMREVSQDKDLKRTEVPDAVHDAIFDEIRRKEEKWEIERRALEQISSENKELIRLGKIYQKDLHRRKYIVLAAILVLAMSMSITSFGGVDRMFHKISSMICGRSRETVDTEGVKTLTEKEEETFAEIEEALGAQLVRLSYRPIGSQFIEANYLGDVLYANIIYGIDDVIKVVYNAYPTYREGSGSKDIEDQVIQRFELELEQTKVEIKEYQVEESEERWLMQFEYEDIYYFIYAMDISESEVIRIIEGLHFPKEG